MEVNIDEKYKISLDAIDVNLLPIQRFLNKHSKDVIPLWSTSYTEAGYNEYYEFEAFFEGPMQSEDADSECEENHNMYTCHICNIDVPKSYIKEHNNSTKHKTCSAIAEHALERIKQHMAQDIDVSSAKRKTSTYFCELCALVVKVNNKANHEKSKEHAISIIHDKHLNDLLKTYVDVSKINICFEINNDTNDASVQVIDKNDDTFEKNDASKQEIDTRKILNTIETPTDTSPMDDVTNKPNKENEITVTKVNKIASAYEKLCDLKKYIKMLSKVNIAQPKHSIKAVDEDYIKIKAISGHRVKVSVDNFHGYFNGENYVQCRVCWVMVEDKETHKMIPEHMEKIAAPIKNKNCVRQLNEIWNHCILCNDIIENVDVHVECSELHINRMIDAVITINDPVKKKGNVFKNDQFIFCEVCNVRLPKGNVNSHLRGMKHEQFLKEKQLIDENDSRDLVIHYQMKISKDSDEFTCRICNVIVTNVTEHISEDEHNNKYKNLLLMNTVFKTNDRVFCEACEAYMVEQYILYHLDSKKHKKKLKSVNEAELNLVSSGLGGAQRGRNKETKLYKSNNHFELTYDANKLRCKTCDILIENDKGTARIHRKSFSHDAHFSSMLNENKLEYVGHRLTCKLCNSTFKQRSVLDHISGEIHKRNLFNHTIRYHDQTVQSNENYIKTRGAQDKFTSNETIYYHPSGTPEYNKFKIQNEQLTGLSENTAVDNNENVELINKVPEVEKGMYYCKFCDICVTESEFDHVASDSHKSNLLNTLKTSKNTYIVAAPKTEHQFYETEVESPKTTEMPKDENEQNLLETTIVDHEVIQVDISASGDDLQSSSIHYRIKSNDSIELLCKTSEEILLAINKLTEIDVNNYFCDICILLVPSMLKFDHVNDDEHRYKFSKLYRSSYNNDSRSTDSIIIKAKNEVADTWKMAINEMTQQTIDVNNTRRADKESIIKRNDIKDYMSEKNNLADIKFKKEYGSDSRIYLNGTQNKDSQIKKYSSDSKINLNAQNKDFSVENDNRIEANTDQKVISATKIDSLYSTSLSPKTYEFVYIDNNVHKNNLRETSSSNEINSVDTKTLVVLNASNVNHEINTQLQSNKQITDPIGATNDNNNTINLRNKVPLHYMMSEDLENPKQVICKICDVKVPYLERNIEEHVTGFNHRAIYKTLLTENKLKIINNEIYCETCKVTVKEICELNHIKDSVHLTNLSNNTVSTDNNINLPNKDQLHYVMSKDSTNPKQVICKVCKAIVPYLKRNIDEHVTGFNHNTYYAIMLCENTLNLLNNKIYCETCKENVPDKCEFDHINSSIHKNNILIDQNGKTMSLPKTQRLHHLLSIETTNSKVVICNVCNIRINNVEKNIDEHLKGSIHTNNYNALLAENKLKKLNNKIYCEVCHVDVPETCELDHIKSSKHHIKHVSNQIGSNNSDRNTLLDKKQLHYMFQKDPKNFNQVICKVCNLKVVFVPRNIDEHVKGFNHTNNYKTILINNKLKNVSDKIYCEICNVYVGLKKEFDHINDGSHAFNLSNNKVLSVKTSKMVLNIKAALHFMMSEDIENPNVVICKVCNVKVPKTTTNIDDHTKGSKHCNTYKTLLGENKLNINNSNKIYCELCKLSGSEATVFNHIASDIHKLNKKVSLDAQANATSNKQTQDLKTQVSSKIFENSKGNNKILVPSTAYANQYTVKPLNDDQVIRSEAISSISQSDKDNNIITKQAKIHYLMGPTENPKELYCKICDNRIPFKNDSVTEHIEGSNHNSKYKLILEANKLKKIADLFYCNVCKCFVDIGHEFNHMCDGKHTINLINYGQPSTSRMSPMTETENELKTQDKVKPRLEIKTEKPEQTLVTHYLMEKTDDSQFGLCKVCKVLVQSKYKYVFEHITSRDHNAKFDPVLNLNNIKRIDDNKRLLCEVCNLYLQYVDVFDHINDKNHKFNNTYPSKKIISSEASNYCQPSTSCMSPMTGTENELRTQDNVKPRLEMKTAKAEQTIVTHYLMETTDDSQFALCKVCKVLVQSKSKYIYEHITSPGHNAKFEPVLNQNNIKRIDNNKGLFCEVCKLHLQYIDVFDHINDENHKINNAKPSKKKRSSNKSKAEEFCDLCQAYFVNIKAHVLGQQHLVKKYIKENPPFLCDICNLKISNNADAIKIHKDGPKHKANFKIILSENNIKIIHDCVCYCQLCNLYLTNNELSVSKHIQTLTHKWSSDP